MRRINMAGIGLGVMCVVWSSRATSVPTSDVGGNAGGMRTLTSEIFNNALQYGTASWAYTAGSISVYSWSYGKPGLVIFGTNETTASIQSTMQNGEYGPEGYQGIALAVPGITAWGTDNNEFYTTDTRGTRPV